MRSNIRAKLPRRAAVAAVAVAAFCAPAPAQQSQAPEKTRTASGFEMILLPGGEFRRGSDSGRRDERPARVIRVDAFYIDAHPVTQEQYLNIIGENPSRWKKPQNPVEQMRWSDAARFLNERSIAEGLTPCYNLETWECDFAADGYRLPTEAEWEYACRAGTTSRYFFGDDAGLLAQFAWFKGNSGGQARPVAKKLPNPWGLFDMSGNVSEWCHDRYSPDYFGNSPESNPRGPASGNSRVLRGGSWDSDAEACASAARHHADPGYADKCFGYDVYGFRAARKAPK